MKEEMKIYNVCDVDYIAATSKQAAQTFCVQELDYEDEDSIGLDELTEEEMNRLKHYGAEWERDPDTAPSFKEELAAEMSKRENNNAFFFATSER